ncbi:DUF1697 domain-containing protein [Krasilnikoviella flava]|uniref:Uncharacterized conserved protein, DUF1697 family n=1 Tax=Krasilnikoviella flava TaxID=526729 RepID=A0A1T5JKA2_9MICO|nr:DUF1697 domain-containing protein [Krasilnikoviella flava]SKC52017.1 Uncharacterized conserved protein, DUF1697 family [Krasilnikoviella flava]
MTFTHVVLYRAMNLGHRGSPVRAELEAALLAAGARAVRSFQTNGTVLLDPGEPGTTTADAAAERVMRAAVPRLAERSGYTHAALVRPLDDVAAAIDGDPFARTRDERTYRETLTFVDGGEPLPVDLPWTDPRDLLDLVAARPGLVLGVVRGGPGSGGDPNGAVERFTGGVATTRTLGTVRRLLAAAARG